MVRLRGRGASWSAWWMLLAFLGALAVSATAVFRLREAARESARTVDRVARIQIAINGLSALWWKALAERRLDHSLSGSLTEARRRTDSLIGELRAARDRGGVLARVQSRHAQYVEAMDPLFVLAAAGHFEGARTLLPRVESGHDAVSQALVHAAAFHEREGEASARLARLGSFGILFSAALGTALVFREREIARQRGRVVVAEAAARGQSEERFAALIENALDAVLIVAVDGRIAYATPAVSRVFGASAESVAGTSVADWTDADGAARLRALLETCAGTTGALPAMEVRSRSDAAVVVEVVASNQLDNPLLGGLVLTCRDVADRRRLESQLRQSQKMDAIGRLAGGIAHDFNNLLGVITGYAELLGRDAGDGRHAGTRAEQILKAAGTAADLTRQLLAFSRQQTLQPAVLDLNPLVLGMEPMLQRLIGERIEVAVLATGEAATVLADKAQIQQVVMNLAVNARDAMPSGGLLLIETGRSGAEVTLAVTDSGRGMDAETATRIFEPFFTTKDAGDGTGLGLATVYGIVAQSGGRIDVESEMGRGSTFRIHLPRAAAEPDEKPETGDLDGTAALPGRTVLLVEDDPGLREFTCELLEDAGYAVVVASHGEEAIGRAGGLLGRIDAIVTDVVMPGMTGPEMVARLRAGGVTAKVLYVSGYSFNAIAWPGSLAPGTDFLAKPFRSAALLGKLHEMIEGVVLPPADPGQ